MSHRNVISKDELSEKIASKFELAGLSKEQSEVIANNLVITEAAGIFSHGLRMVDSHLKRVKNRTYNLYPAVRTIKQSDSFSLIDADNSVGMYAATIAMTKAIENAQKTGIHTVFVKNANTFGAAFTYSKMATDLGLIGICFSNSPAAMAPWGGKIPLIGTNPISIGIPGKSNGPILFDMASSKVAKSKVGIALANNEKIPMDWAIDSDGNPTDDPQKALQGSVLPMAEHKGYGLALCLDILSGLISGSAFADDVNKFYSTASNNPGMNVGQTFIAIDPRHILGETFYTSVDSYIDKIHREDGSRFPGENTVLHLLASEKRGILSNDVIESLLNDDSETE